MKTKDSPAPTEEAFHGVEIQCTADACNAARSRSGTRYLSGEAPWLPLKDCDRSDRCRCRYRHFSDRRQAPRRMSEGGLPSAIDTDTDERRNVKDRREESPPEHKRKRDEKPLVSLDDTYYNHYRKNRS